MTVSCVRGSPSSGRVPRLSSALSRGHQGHSLERACLGSCRGVNLASRNKLAGYKPEYDKICISGECPGY
jgi:hypothetical protein